MLNFDLFNSLRNGVMILKESYFTKRNFDILLAIVSINVGVYLDWELKDVVMLTSLVWLFLNPWPSYKFAKVAIFFLILLPFFLMMGKDKYAEQASIYVFYFFIMTVVSSFLEFRTKD